MVENNEYFTVDLNNKKTSRSDGIITTENFENDIFRLFLREEYIDLEEKKKIRNILARADDTIIEWHRDNYGDTLCEMIDFEK